MKATFEAVRKSLAGLADRRAALVHLTHKVVPLTEKDQAAKFEKLHTELAGCRSVLEETNRTFNKQLKG